jgi:hypothetical protein
MTRRRLAIDERGFEQRVAREPAIVEVAVLVVEREIAVEPGRSEKREVLDLVSGVRPGGHCRKRQQEENDEPFRHHSPPRCDHRRRLYHPKNFGGAADSTPGPLEAGHIITNRMMTFAERHPGRTFAMIGMLFAVIYTTALVGASGRTRFINGDAIQYYAYLRSVVFDRDLDFANEYERFYGGDADSGAASVWVHARTATGRSPNLMSVGPALLWSPFYLAVLVGVSLASSAGVPVAVNGYSAPFQIAAGVAGIVYATLGVYLRIEPRR